MVGLRRTQRRLPGGPATVGGAGQAWLLTVMARAAGWTMYLGGRLHGHDGRKVCFAANRRSLVLHEELGRLGRLRGGVLHREL